MKASRQIIIDAIKEQIELGKPRAQVLSKIIKKCQFTERTFDRYWKIANNQFAEKQAAIKRELDEVDKQAAIEARKKAIMAADERKEYLTKIITGEIEVPYKEAKWDRNQNKFVTINFVELANHNARISAIAELNKMEGDYAPTKIAETDTAGNDISRKSDEELLARLAQLEKIIPTPKTKGKSKGKK